MTAFRNLVLWGKYLLPTKAFKKARTASGARRTIPYRRVVQIVRIEREMHGKRGRMRSVYYLRNMNTGRFMRKPVTTRRFALATRLRDDWQPGRSHIPWGEPEPLPKQGERGYCVTKNCMGKQTRKSQICLRCQRGKPPLHVLPQAAEAEVIAYMPEEFVLKD